MSVGREVIANVNHVPENLVNCEHCARHSKFIGKMLWCDGWDMRTRAGDFCSFYLPLENIKKEEITNG